MAYANEVSKGKVPKHSLVRIIPKTRVTGWVIDPVDGVNIWYAPFTKGRIDEVKLSLGIALPDGTTELNPTIFTRAAAYPPAGGEFYQDEAAGLLYLYNGGSNPDTALLFPAGVVASYSLFFSDAGFTGPLDPLDPDTDHVWWMPVLESAPETSNGSRQSLFGFNPVQESALALLNQDNWAYPHLYDSSFSFAEVISYVMADKDLEHAAARGNVKEIFRGYAGAPALSSDGQLTIPCSDFLSRMLNLAEPAARFSVASFPNVDPQAVGVGAEWWIRKVRGMVDNFVPVNIDFNSAPATNVNRKFVTQEDDGAAGTIALTLDYANAGNSGTRTYFTTTPKVNVGDEMVIQRAGVNRYTYVTAVNYAGKYVDHVAIAGAATLGDTATRYYIGWVRVQSTNGAWKRIPLSQITMISGAGPDYRGFQLANNWEAAIAFPDAAFDPSSNRIVCRVYGTKDLPVYADAVTPVGAVVDEGGIRAQAVSLLYELLVDFGGIDPDLIDQDAFESLDAGYSSLGFAIPASAGDHAAPAAKQLIQNVLQSMIWRLTYTDVDGRVNIGVQESGPGPYIDAAEFDVDELDFSGLQFEHDYDSMYNTFVISYRAREVERQDDFDLFETTKLDGTKNAVLAESLLAYELHGVVAQFELDILQYVKTHATKIAQRYSYLLGDRLGFFTAKLGQQQIAESAVGAAVNVKSTRLPGYVYDIDTDRTRQTIVVEVQKSSEGVTIVADDQKGAQDNAGEWS